VSMIMIDTDACGRLPAPTALDNFTVENLPKTAGFDSTANRPLNAYATFAISPTGLRAILAMQSQLNGPTSELTMRDRTLMILRIAGLTQCEYEIQPWIPAAQRLGLSDEQISSMTTSDRSGAGHFNGRDRIIILLAEALSATGNVPEDLVSDAMDVLTPSELVEVVVRIGYSRTIMGLLNTAKPPVDV
jgi:alkylhydroperoxidase family enzyme